MHFEEVNPLDLRRKLAYRVLVEGCPVAGAAREAGLSRVTAYLWIERAREVGIENLYMKPRVARSCPHRVPEQVEEQLLAYKHMHRTWGAKKIVHALWREQEAPLSVRTADRILKRRGLTRLREREELQRFERSACNELWQMDFKGLRRRPSVYEPLSVIDDHSRFCLGVIPLRSPSSRSVFEALWDLFGEFGLPECILSDNGDCFNSTKSSGGPTPLQAKLWLLGVYTTHGRPRHPQTQGKVERFHRTLQEELGETLFQPSVEVARSVFKQFVNQYNWIRPHEALGMAPPGAIYASSPRKRPHKMPEHEPTGHRAWRKVDAVGQVRYRGKVYHAGKGLAHEHIEIAEEENGLGFYYASRRFSGISFAKSVNNGLAEV